MERYARPPGPLQKKQPMDKTWRIWKEEFITFMNASGYMNHYMTGYVTGYVTGYSNNITAHLLLNLMGSVGQEALQAMQLEDPAVLKDMEKLIKSFDLYFDPPKQETEERLSFFKREKKDNEKMEDYINELKALAKSCNFGNQMESLIRDMVIFHTNDKMLRKLFLSEKNLDLGKIIMIHGNYELNKEKIKQVIDTKPESTTEFKHPCRKCGRKHPYKQCPAFGRRCDGCQEMNHFKNCCPKKSQAKAPENINNQPKQQNDKVEKNLAGPFQQIDKANKIMNMQYKNVLVSNTGTSAQISKAAESSTATKNVPPAQPKSAAVKHEAIQRSTAMKSVPPAQPKSAAVKHEAIQRSTAMKSVPPAPPKSAAVKYEAIQSSTATKNIPPVQTKLAALNSETMKNSTLTKKVPLMPPARSAASESSARGGSVPDSKDEPFVHLPGPEDISYHRHHTNLAQLSNRQSNITVQSNGSPRNNNPNPRVQMQHRTDFPKKFIKKQEHNKDCVIS